MVIALGACAGPPLATPRAEFAEQKPVLPGAGAAPLPAPTSPPQNLGTVESDKLGERERTTWWKLVNQLYAPCTDQAVSIAQCVKEQRPCAACAPAAELVAAKVQAGGTPQDVEAAYAVRFGPNVKKAEVKGSPAKGPEGAPVVMIVWSDFQCPACGRAVPIIGELAKKFPEDLRLVHKFYPLGKHPRSLDAARAAVAAQNQGKYWEMERLLFENQQALSESDIEGYAQKLGLDIQRFRTDMRSDKTKEIIERDKADADTAGLRGTPFILINGREFDTTYFRIDTELEPWIRLESKLAPRSTR
jgi:protein-disulfide isomerase